MNEERTEMTDEQIENWRSAIARMFGPIVARVATREQIHNMRDNIQMMVERDAERIKREMEAIESLSFDVGDTVRVQGQGKGKVLDINYPMVKIKWSYGGRDTVNVHSVEKA